MRYLIAACVLAGVVCTGLRGEQTPATQEKTASGPSAVPKLRLAEVQKIEPISHRVELTLDPGQERFSGSIHIQLRVNAPARTIWLNANKLTIDRVSLSLPGQRLAGRVTTSVEDFVALEFERTVPAGASQLDLEYTGALHHGDGSAAFVLEDKGNKYVFTQFESTNARAVFPCFDEPSYKVPWQLTLHIPASDSAVSNTAPQSDKTDGASRTIVFARTKPLPSYLVAFAVGPFEYVDAGRAGKKQVPVRIVVPRGRSQEGAYAAAVTATILGRLEEYFGVPYPYDKADQVSVPMSLFGAMENAGIVTYAQAIILAEPASDSFLRQRNFVTVAAHELAHQWFGDLVTTAWWDDTWLNEAFATWMQQKMVADWKPEWKTRVDDVKTSLAAARNDSLVSARQIRQPITSKGDIDDAFDGITYNKGAAVIGMFEHWIGPRAFRDGVRRYLNRHAFGNATAADFLTALDNGSNKVTAPFSTFLNQPGIPVVSLSLDCTRRPTLHLEQQRLLPVGSKGSTDQLWSIPVCARSDRGAACTVFSRRSADWSLEKGCPAWIEANADAAGYYRVVYPGPLLKALTAEGAPPLPTAERVELMGNVAALATSGALPAADSLALAERFHADSDAEVVSQAVAVARLSAPDPMAPSPLVPDDLTLNYQRFIRSSFGAQARALGWTSRPGEPDDMRRLRSTLLLTVATRGGDRELAGDARRLADAWFANRASLDAAIRAEVLEASAYYGDRALFDRFLAAYKQTENGQERRDILSGMMAFRDASAVDAALDLLPSGQMPLDDGLLLLLRAGSADRGLATRAFDRLKPQFEDLVAKYPTVFNTPMASIMMQVGFFFCDARTRADYVNFFEPKLPKYEAARRTYSQALERMDLCIALKQAQQPSIAEFLKKY